MHVTIVVTQTERVGWVELILTASLPQSSFPSRLSGHMMAYEFNKMLKAFLILALMSNVPGVLPWVQLSTAVYR